MSDTPDELLSAYLDGELTAEEKVRIERQLADSAELRQLLDELRAIRAGLQSLPRYQLDEDFAQRVLRKAEQAMLAETPTAAATAAESSPAAAEDIRPSVASETFRRWKSGGPRVWGWAAAAIAASVVFMVLDRRPAVQPPAGGEPLPKIGDANWVAKDGAGSGTNTSLDAVADDETDHTRSEPAIMGKAGPPGASGTNTTFGAVATKGGGGGGGGSTSGLGGEQPNAAPPINALAGAEKKGPRKDENEKGAITSPATDNEMLVVHCTITPEAARERKFDELLNNRQIAVDDLGQVPASNVAVAPQEIADVPSRTAGPAKQDLAKDAGVATTASPAQSEVDAVLVETTAGDLSGVLSDLNKKPEWFPTVEITPAPAAPAQQAWTAYNRGESDALQKERWRQVAADSDRKTELSTQNQIVNAPAAPATQTQTLQQPAQDQGQKTQFDATVDKLNNLAGGNRGNFTGNGNNGRAQRLSLPRRADLFQNDSAEVRRDRALQMDPSGGNARQSQLGASEPASSPAGAAAAAPSAAPGITNLGEQTLQGRSFKTKENIALGSQVKDVKEAGQETAPVRALFLLRVVEPAAPANQEPMTK